MSDEFVLQSSVLSGEEGFLGKLAGQEGRLRAFLRGLLRDEEFEGRAWTLLCLIGNPADLSLLSRDSRAQKADWLESLASSFFQPSSELQWRLLRRAATQQWEGARPDWQAIRTLRLMESSRADGILQEALAVNGRMEGEIRRAIEHRRAWRSPTFGKVLERLVEETGQGLKPELWSGTRGIFPSADGTKALAQIVLENAEDRFVYEATYYRQGEMWFLRGLQYVMQEFKAPKILP